MEGERAGVAEAEGAGVTEAAWGTAKAPMANARRTVAYFILMVVFLVVRRETGESVGVTKINI